MDVWGVGLIGLCNPGDRICFGFHVHVKHVSGASLRKVADCVSLPVIKHGSSSLTRPVCFMRSRLPENA